MTLQIVIAEDSVLFREGLVRLLNESGHDVAAAVGDAESLTRAVADGVPDLVIVDVRMPPDMTDDGARAAIALRALHPELPILLLSQHVETRHAVDLVGTGAFGYLLKDRVLRVDDFVDAVERVASGGSALDPSVVAALVSPRRREDALVVRYQNANWRCSNSSPKGARMQLWHRDWSWPNVPSRPTCDRSSRSSRSPTPATTTAGYSPSSST